MKETLANIFDESKKDTLEQPINIDIKEPIDIIETTNEIINNDTKEEINDEKNQPTITEPINILSNISDDLFETVSPFTEPQLFMDRNDESGLKKESNQIINFPEFESIEPKEQTEVITSNNLEMPQAFWPTQETGNEVEIASNDEKLSFDEQINILMLNENNKTLKKVA